MNQSRLAWLVGVVLFTVCGATSAHACGGFFCQLVPIDQAGEQIIFRQDGESITAVVLIQYEGEAEDFSWVVPVPGVPELSVGSDQVFAPLDVATRPQFDLTVTGSACPVPFDLVGIAAPGQATLDSSNEGAEDVTIIDESTVGPFLTQVVGSEDPAAMALWLEENGYDLSDRGEELIAPYVDEGMNFVALKLRQDQGVGDIRPLIMKYTSNVPKIPIRLTAVAALPDMGVLVWILGSSRAVPTNYLHVTPNYTRLNWYAGQNNAYASYQTLITAAMNEAGGQGFATDYAGRDLDAVSQLPSADTFEDEMSRLAGIEDGAQFVSEVATGFVFPFDQVLEILQRRLPLPLGDDTFVYQIPELLTNSFTEEELSNARAEIIVDVNETIIDPLRNTLDVLSQGDYLTRLYTTLSPEDMTLDPEFEFNPDLAGQPARRAADLNLQCEFGRSSWTLTLGEGTGREGEVVIEGVGDPPTFSFQPLTIEQEDLWRAETVTASGPPQVVTQKTFDVAQVGDDSGQPLGPLCGPGGFLFATIIGLGFMRRRSAPFP